MTLPDRDGWWRHPGHLRKCKLGGENVLERVRERVRVRERRKFLTRAIVTTFSVLVTVFTVVVMAAVALGGHR